MEVRECYIRNVGRMMVNTFKVQTSAGEVIASIFWDNEGIFSMLFLNRSATMNSEQYVHTLKMLKQ
jgi:hypothetical protein